MAKIRVRDFRPQDSDVILMDTNILIDLFYPMNPEKNVKDISDLYQRMLKAKSKMIITSIQVSEFVNKCIRFQFDLYKSHCPECVRFKQDYRNTDDYTQSMAMIVQLLKNEWMQKMTFVDDKFSELSFDKILNFKISYDFNDAILFEIAKKYNAIIITNDADIINYDVKGIVVTDNNFILSCR